MKERVYKYDNVKALLLFLVAVGHMASDYVSDSHLVRWVTLCIYLFHMPALIFLSGLVHKQYITEDAAFSLDLFKHPCVDLMRLAARITSGKKRPDKVLVK